MTSDLGFGGDEQQEILLGFVEEGREMLDEVEPLLIELEEHAMHSGEIDLEVINTVFRLFHSLKGGAGFLDLNTVNGVTHVAETLLDHIRKGRAKLHADHIDLLTRTCDFIRVVLDQIEEQLHDRGFDNEADDIIKQLNATIEALGQEAPVESIKLDEPEENSAASAADSSGSPSQAEAEEDAFKLTITPEMVEAFVSEAQELLETGEEALLALENEPGNQDTVDTAFRAFHSFKGNAAFLGYTDLVKLGHYSETVLDFIRTNELEPADRILTMLLELLDMFRTTLDNINEGKPATIHAAPGLINYMKMLVHDLNPDLSFEEVDQAQKPAAPPAPAPEPEPEQAEASAPASKEEPAAKEPDVQPLEEKKAPETEKEPAAKQEAAKSAETEKQVSKAGSIKDVQDELAKLKPKQDAAASVKRPTMNQQQHQTVRVDVEKLDQLLDLVGELVITEAMVAQSPDIQALDLPLEQFEKSARQLEKITRDLQDISTSMRMIPLSGVFRRMLRLVRDLSKKSGKLVSLDIIGEETEVDKTVIEQIADPLVHVIRNSIDHGLEVPEERVKAGKPEKGTVTLEAKYVGGEVWIQIRDDGRGLNRERILQRAQERGLIPDDGSDMRDEEVWPLIFQPGFSTAEKVTDISGRGVGMDVVRRNIESIRGKVDVQSQAGKGSTVTLRIPLTLAIIDGMIVRVGQAKYTIPLVTIKESLQPRLKDVTYTPDGTEIVKIRNELLPVIRLGPLFGIMADSEELEAGILIVVENNDDRVCLLVDEMIGQQQIVIKGLSDYIMRLTNLNNISGCTILGDGVISLIIDIEGLIRNVQHELSD